MKGAKQCSSQSTWLLNIVILHKQSVYWFSAAMKVWPSRTAQNAANDQHQRHKLSSQSSTLPKRTHSKDSMRNMISAWHRGCAGTSRNNQPAPMASTGPDESYHTVR